MRVIVTRPASDAPAWVQALQHAGYEALSLPLIDIQATRHTDAVKQAWAKWPTYAAAMFVSAQAVRFFFQHRMLDLGSTRCWATQPAYPPSRSDTSLVRPVTDRCPLF